MKKRIRFAAAMTVMAAALGPAAVGAAVDAQAQPQLPADHPCPGPDGSGAAPGCDSAGQGASAYGPAEPGPISPPVVGTYNGGLVGIDAGGGS
jgi:hypothetical protein